MLLSLCMLMTLACRIFIKAIVNEDLSKIELWLKGNKLSLNVGKTQSMVIGSIHLPSKVISSTDFEISNESIDQVTSTKYLSVQIDDKHIWKNQLDTLSEKISKATGLKKYADRYLPLNTIQGFYKSLVEQQLRYCCSGWGCANRTILDRLQKLQNMVIRIISNTKYHTPESPRLSHLGLLSISSFVKEESTQLVFKSLSKLAPDYMQHLFVRRSRTWELRIPFLQTSGCQNFFAYRGSKFFRL